MHVANTARLRIEAEAIKGRRLTHFMAIRVSTPQMHLYRMVPRVFLGRFMNVFIPNREKSILADLPERYEQRVMITDLNRTKNTIGGWHMSTDIFCAAYEPPRVRP